MRRYDFWDERYQLFLEKNIEYSSFYTSKDTPDGPRVANPTLVLKDIIKTASSHPPVMKTLESNTKIKVGFKQTGSISSPSEEVGTIDEENWDKGYNGSAIFYTSPAKTNAVEDINYVLDLCVAEDGGPVILDLGRNSDDKKWKLLSLTSIFKNSQNDQIERLIIEDSLVSNKPPVGRASANTSGNIINFSSPIASRITSYGFVPMVAVDDLKITNNPIHNFNFNSSTFNIYFKENTAAFTRDKFEELAKKGLYSYTKGTFGGAHALLNINNTKAKGVQIDNTFTPHEYYPSNYNSVKMLRDSVFLNESIHFNVPGLTIRTPGKFIFIDSLASDGNPNVFHDRFYGQWLITKVNHHFSKKNYTTEVFAVKTDSSSKI